MFDNLQERLERSFKILKGEGKITEINVAETLKDIRRALLDADVSFRVAKDFCDRVKVKAMGQNVLTAVKPQQMMVKIVHDELAEFMGSASQDINIKGNPGIVLVAGLNGSGKTTFSAKLANNIKSKRGMKVLLAACDTFRPAAIEQLKVLGEGIEVPVYTEEGVKDPIRIARNAIAKAKAEGYSVVIIDTAGRLAVDQELMDEISALHSAVKPTESLFVVDAMTGQDAVETAKVFNERLDFDGVVLTKMDGDTRGGAALSIKYVTGKPIKFISSGEKMEAMDVFHPGRVADRILGMGDVVSLVEKAQEQFDEKQARETRKKLAKKVARKKAIVICCLDFPYTVGLTTLVEAYALGIPVVCSKNPNFEIDIDKEEIGIAVEYGDVEGWVKAIRYLSTHPEKAREMGENARKLGEKRFNLEIFSKEIAQRLLHISTKNS